MSTRLLSASIAAAVIVAVLAGCATPAPSPSASTPSGTPTASATPTPTPSPTAAAPDLTLTADGIADIQIGEPISSPLARLDPEFCRVAYPDLEWDDAEAAEWVVQLPGLQAPTAGEGETVRDPLELFAGGEGGSLRYAIVHSPDLVSAGGIGLGSTLDELRAAHPEARLAAEGGVSDVWAIDGARGSLVFEVPTDARTTGYWAPEELDSVRYVRIQSADVELRPIAGSDGINRCAL